MLLVLLMVPGAVYGRGSRAAPSEPQRPGAGRLSESLVLFYVVASSLPHWAFLWVQSKVLCCIAITDAAGIFMLDPTPELI